MEHCDFDSKVKSIKVPGGLEVSGYGRKNLQIRIAGPYRGPVTVDRVDSPWTWKSVNITGQTEEDKELEKTVTTSRSDVNGDISEPFFGHYLRTRSRLTKNLKKSSFVKHKFTVAARSYGDKFQAEAMAPGQRAEDYKHESDA